MPSHKPQAEDSDDWQRVILALEQEASEAFVKRDLARLDQIFSDDLLVNSPINRINDKKKLLELLGAGIVSHVSLTSEHELIRREADLVIVMGADTVRDTDTAPLVRRRFTNIWRNEGGRWRLYVRHANVIAPRPDAKT
jgi:ketosteroid isomerase-like protein